MLKVLRWARVECLNDLHIIQLCKSLTDHSEFSLSRVHRGSPFLNPQLILKIVENAGKLQSLYGYSDTERHVQDRCAERKCVIDVDTYTKMVQSSVGRNCIHRWFWTDIFRYTANILRELTKCHAVGAYSKENLEVWAVIDIRTATVGDIHTKRT